MWTAPLEYSTGLLDSVSIQLVSQHSSGEWRQRIHAAATQCLKWPTPTGTQRILVTAANKSRVCISRAVNLTCGMTATVTEHSAPCANWIYQYENTLEMGKEPEPCKNEPNKNPGFAKNRSLPRKEQNRTRTQMSCLLLGSFSDLDCTYIHRFHGKRDILLYLG